MGVFDPRVRWVGVADRWPARHAIIATLIQPGASVIDLGCGAGGLQAHLPAGCEYAGVDLPEFDMDRGLWPDGHWDVAVMAGVLEYARYPAAVMRHIHEIADAAVISYVHHPKKRDGMWNNLSKADIEALAAKAGFTAREAATWQHKKVRPQTIWVFR